MYLRKINLLCRTVRSSPTLDFTLKSPKLPFLKDIRILFTKPLKQGLSLQLGSLIKLSFCFRPNRFKRILSGPPIPVFNLSRRQLA